MPGWDVTVRPGKEEKKKDDTWVIVVVAVALLLLILNGGGCNGVDRGRTDQGCVHRDASRCDHGSGSGGHRGDGRGSGHDGEDRDPPDRRGP